MYDAIRYVQQIPVAHIATYFCSCVVRFDVFFDSSDCLNAQEKTLVPLKKSLPNIY